MLEASYIFAWDCFDCPACQNKAIAFPVLVFQINGTVENASGNDMISVPPLEVCLAIHIVEDIQWENEGILQLHEPEI